MAEPFLGEIKMVGFNFAMRSWAFCNGQLMPINQNQSLYSLLGTTFGGDGRTTFALPDMRSRVPLHKDAQNRQGLRAGQEAVKLTPLEIPQHTHAMEGTSATANTPTPANNSLYAKAGFNAYGEAANLTSMAAGSVANAGGAGGHDNMQPIQVINFCIALQGLFPSRN